MIDARSFIRPVWPLVAAFALIACPSAEEGVSTSASPPNDASTGGSSTGTSGSSTLVQEGTGGGTSGGETVDAEVVVGCGDLPVAAVGANFEHAFDVEPSGTWSWDIEGLPDGLTFSPISGAIEGAPTSEGTAEFVVSVSGSQGEGSTTCTLEIGAALAIDLSALDGPCLGPDDDLADFITGGNGTALSCDTPDGNGDGRRPADVSVGVDSCAIEGEPTVDEYGTWVWITHVEQAGATTFVPYCITQAEPADGSYVVTANVDGDPAAILSPGLGTFAAGDPISFGGNGDPHFEIVGACGGGACFYGFVFNVGPSPFGECEQPPCFSLDPNAILTDDDGVSVGMQHDMAARGPAVPRDFETRPFVLPWDLTYCLSAEQGDCQGAKSTQANAGARVHYSVLMTPA